MADRFNSRTREPRTLHSNRLNSESLEPKTSDSNTSTSESKTSGSGSDTSGSNTSRSNTLESESLGMGALGIESLESDGEHPFTRRRLISALLVLTTFLIMAVFLQERESGWFSTWATYRIRRDQLTMTRPPEWVTENLPAALFDTLILSQRGEATPNNSETNEQTTQNDFANDENVDNGKKSTNGGATTVGPDETISLLDNRLIPEIRRILESYPAVKRVEQIRRRYPAGLAISVEYGTPACLVVVEPGEPPPFSPPSTSVVTATSVLRPEFYLIGSSRELLATPNAELADRLAKQYAKVVVLQRLLREGDFCVDSRIAAVLEILRSVDAKMSQEWDEIRLVPIPDGYHIVFKAGENEFFWGKSPTNLQTTSLNSRTESIQSKLEQLAQLTQKYGTLRSNEIPDSEKTLK